VTSEVVTTILGAVLGLVTGLWLDRRTARSAESQNRELRLQLNTLRSTIYSLGGDPDTPQIKASDSDILSTVRSRALATQDASGKVRRSEILAYFIGKGLDGGDVEAAIMELRLATFFEEEGRWLRIR